LVSNFQEFVFSIDTKISISKRTKSELKSSIDKHIEQFSGHTVKRILAHDWHRANTKEKRMFENLSSRYPYISFGVSIYDLSEFQEIRFCFQTLNVFQIPLNIINQAFLHLPNQTLSGNSIEFVVRSILLQGALDWNNPRNPFSNHPDIVKLSRFARTNGLSAIELTACFIQQSGYEEIVLGANSAKQLTELVKSFNYDYSELDFGPYASNDAQLKDPRCWNF
jgi:aryl-alcohol dehydrogenase-like predicted oxidoreductase